MHSAHLPEPPSAPLPLIGAKLAPPRLGSAAIERAGLLRQLEQHRDRRLALVLGPAGSGKSSLLAQWRKRRIVLGSTVAWYNAGIQDDEVQVAAYLVAALRQAGLGIDGGGLHLFAQSGGKAWQPLLAALVNDIQDSGREVCLVIDDFHHLASGRMLDFFERWLSLMPDNFHLVLGSRSKPAFDLSRHRAEGQLLELKFDELRFSGEETRRYVESRGLGRLSDAQVARLHAITDGWIAAMQLLAFSLRNGKNIDSVLASPGLLPLAGETAINHYLEEAVTGHLGESELDFLVRVSITRRFTHELAAQLSANPEAGAILQRIEAENLFLLPIDFGGPEPWFRFHPIFSGFLRQRLERLPRQDLAHLHEVASRWFAANDHAEEALRHASEAGNAGLFLELVSRLLRRMAHRTQHTEYLKWSERIPWEVLRTQGYLLLGRAFAQISCARYEELELTLSTLQGRSWDEPHVQSGILLLKAYLALRRDDTHTQMRLLAEFWKISPGPPTVQQSVYYAINGLGLIKSRQYDAARELARSRRSHGANRLTPLIDIMLGVSHLAEGNMREALPRMTPSFAALEELASLAATDGCGFVAGYLIEAHFQLNQLDEAHALLDRYQALIDAVRAVDSIQHSYRVRARLHRIRHEHDEALKVLRRLEELGRQQQLDRLLAWSLHDQVCLRLAQDAAAEPAELLGRMEQLASPYAGGSDCAWAEIPLALAMARAEMAFARSTGLDGLDAIEAAGKTAAVSGDALLRSRLDCMRAILHLECGQAGPALQLGTETLHTATRLGHLRLIAELGPRAAPLARALLERGGEAGLDNWLRSSLDEIDEATRLAGPDAGPKKNRSGKAQDHAHLGPKELEILTLLSRALSIKTIALAVNITQGTVRWHIKNIYLKLGVTSKDAALARARQLKLLP